MMIRLRRAAGLAVIFAALACAPAAASQQPAPATGQPQQQDEFVPIDQLPPQDQLPAAPLLIAAYSFVVVALFTYVLSVSRRLGRVQREMDRLATDLKKTGRA
jgi:CcmD family protein